MGKISKYNVAVTHGAGKAGNVRFYQNGGNTYMRAAHPSVVNNPRTAAQMHQRLLHGSKTRLWAILKPALTKCFVKEGAQSDFNIFMKLNNNIGVYYTKAESMAGACTAMPLQIASGNGLQAIVNTYISASRQMKTNISLGSLVIDSSTTVGAFSAAILANNPDRFKEGDEIAFISLLQSSWYNNDGLEIPTVSMNKYRIVLKVADSRVLGNLVSLDGYHSLDGYLATNSNMPAGCFGYLHTRSDNGTIKTASSSLCDANEDYYDEWRSDEVFEIAAESYGKGDDVFADPNSEAGGDTPTPSPSGNFTITVNVAAGQEDYGVVSGGGQYPAGASAIIAAAPNSGYHFVAWSDGNTSMSRTITVSQNATFTATFAENSTGQMVTVTVTSADATQGKIAINNGAHKASDSVTVESGTTVTVKALAESGYAFSSWSDGNLNFERTLTPTSNVTLEAEFEVE